MYDVSPALVSLPSSFTTSEAVTGGISRRVLSRLGSPGQLYHAPRGVYQQNPGAQGVGGGWQILEFETPERSGAAGKLRAGGGGGGARDGDAAAGAQHLGDGADLDLADVEHLDLGADGHEAGAGGDITLVVLGALGEDDRAALDDPDCGLAAAGALVADDDSAGGGSVGGGHSTK